MKIFKKIRLFVAFPFMIICTGLTAQVKIGDNPGTVDASAALELEKSNLGLLITRVALTDATDQSTILNPANSLLIFNTANAGTGGDVVSPGFYFWDNGAVRWKGLATSAGPAGDLWVDGNGNILSNNSANQSLSGSSVISIGDGAFEDLGGTTNHLIAIGPSACNSDSTTGDVYNVAIGSGAAFSNKGAYLNAMGREAARFNKGDYVNAFGLFAAYYNFHNYVNALGPNAALYNNANHVNALGYGAAQSNQGESLNAFGQNAAHDNDAPNVNALGDGAAQSNLGESLNAFGFDAAHFNSGINVNAFGLNAALNNEGENVNAIGYSAAIGNLQNSVNAFGSFAAAENISTDVNAIGAGAAQRNAAANVNAIGVYAAGENLGGNLNAFGTYAGTYNMGLNVNAMGEHAALDNTGDDVNAFGREAASENNNSHLVAIGDSAGYNNYGWCVTALGWKAAAYNRGDHSIAIGERALFGPTNGGEGNIAIGWNAANTLWDGAYNVAIGHAAYLPDDNASNQININNSIIRDEYGVISLKDLIKLTPLDTPPSNPEEGMIYYDSATQSLWFYNGTEWKEISYI